jgi:SAM-dependent methyltransferase
MTSHAGYAERARYYAAEIGQAPEPALLAGLLRPGLVVAEMPSGTGHFLATYSAAGAGVTLVDACPQMTRAAQAQATRNGITVTTVRGMIEDLPGQAGPFGLIVMPNGALSQLAATAAPARLLAAAARLLAPGGLLLAQVLDPGAACGFYDPGLADGHWRQDRQFPGEDGRLVTRRRRQHHHGDIVAVDFEMSCDGQAVHSQRVTLRLLASEDLRAALAGAGLRAPEASPGPGGLAEILCTLPRRGQR